MSEKYESIRRKISELPNEIKESLISYLLYQNLKIDIRKDSLDLFNDFKVKENCCELINKISPKLNEMFKDVCIHGNLNDFNIEDLMSKNIVSNQGIISLIDGYEYKSIFKHEEYDNVSPNERISLICYEYLIISNYLNEKMSEELLANVESEIIEIKTKFMNSLESCELTIEDMLKKKFDVDSRLDFSPYIIMKLKSIGEEGLNKRIKESLNDKNRSKNHIVDIISLNDDYYEHILSKKDTTSMLVLADIFHGMQIIMKECEKSDILEKHYGDNIFEIKKTWRDEFKKYVEKNPLIEKVKGNKNGIGINIYDLFSEKLFNKYEATVDNQVTRVKNYRVGLYLICEKINKEVSNKLKYNSETFEIDLITEVEDKSVNKTFVNILELVVNAGNLNIESIGSENNYDFQKIITDKFFEIYLEEKIEPLVSSIILREDLIKSESNEKKTKVKLKKF